MRWTNTRFILLLVLSAVATWPGRTAAAVAGESQFSGTIVLGATFPRSGELEYYGLSAYYGATTAVRMINARGGVNGKELVLEWRDNRSEREQARLDIVELAREKGVPAVIGPLLSDSAMAVRETARELGVVVLSPMSTIDALPEPDPWVFRSVFSNSAEALALTRFQREKFGFHSCSILYDSNHMVGADMATTFARTFTEAGGRVTGTHSIRGADGSLTLSAVLDEVEKERPDFLFAPMYGVEALSLILALRDRGIDTPVCGSNTWDNEVVFDGAGTRLVGTSFASVLFERAATRQFREFFTAMEAAGMENPDASAACAYDAVMLLAKALETGESAEEIRAGLLAVRNFNLATGRITITPDGDTRKPVLVRMVERQGCRLVPVYAERYDPPAERRNARRGQ
ncbi:MAG: ABC transporter substrate-binding protein [Planctomycetes bacterium]|nr:ABC transporter substrate-binding protein [Planctomycetota bacterium]